MLAIKSGMGIVKKSQRNLFSPVYLKILQVFVATFFFFFFAQHIATMALGPIIVTFTFAGE